MTVFLPGFKALEDLACIYDMIVLATSNIPVMWVLVFQYHRGIKAWSLVPRKGQ